MSIHPNWRNILLYAWSERFNGIGLVFSGAVLFLQMVQPYSRFPPYWFAIGAFICFLAAGVSRIISQDKFKVDNGSEQ